MRRLLVILLLGIVSMQAVWASAARYCAHEPTAPVHFGHHEHKHVAPHGISAPDLSGGEADLDCSACHLSCSASIPAIAAVSTPALRAPLSEHPQPDFRSHASSVPVRPDIAGAFVAVRSVA